MESKVGEYMKIVVAIEKELFVKKQNIEVD